MATVEPKETNELFANPGMGWQTFHRFADEDRALEGLPSSSAYFRFYWKELEPAEGQIDFEKLDSLLARARRAGQKLAFRVMCAGTDKDPLYVPRWLKEQGCKGFDYRYQGSEVDCWIPDFDDSLFRKAHFRLIEELGKRYDGHPDVDLLDIGSVGLWGEWHMSGTLVDVPSQETCFEIIDAYCRAFPNTLKAMLLDGADALRHATGKGCGWRADCLGDMGGFSKTWNHMDHCYRQTVAESGSQDVWKTAPVAWESCWDMRKWKAEGWDIPYIFDYGLGFHASYMNNKSAPIPEGTRPEVERFLKKLGYRLVLRKLEHPDSVRAGDFLPIRMEWENVGAAPPYRNDRVAFCLFDSEGREVVAYPGSREVRGWLPGHLSVQDSIEMPFEIRPGHYALAVGVVDTQSHAPSVKLAIEGGDDIGWHPLSRIEVKAA
ncbi:MAG: DUF4832 domain-containing protein [Armatimonadetes bacterium]|nr:DUF4832 domain-containing protein [Armatimonadota bacterium]